MVIRYNLKNKFIPTMMRLGKWKDSLWPGGSENSLQPVGDSSSSKAMEAGNNSVSSSRSHKLNSKEEVVMDGTVGGYLSNNSKFMVVGQAGNSHHR